MITKYTAHARTPVKIRTEPIVDGTDKNKIGLLGTSTVAKGNEIIFRNEGGTWLHITEPMEGFIAVEYKGETLVDVSEIKPVEFEQSMVIEINGERAEYAFVRKLP